MNPKLYNTLAITKSKKRISKFTKNHGGRKYGKHACHWRYTNYWASFSKANNKTLSFQWWLSNIYMIQVLLNFVFTEVGCYIALIKLKLVQLAGIRQSEADYMRKLIPLSRDGMFWWDLVWIVFLIKNTFWFKCKSYPVPNRCYVFHNRDLTFKMRNLSLWNNFFMLLK